VNGLRLWISILALVSFLAGVAAGLVAGEYSRKAPPDERFFGDFEREFVEHFELDAVRQSHLAELLLIHRAEIEKIKHRHTAELNAQMEEEFRSAGLEYRSLVRNHLLPERQRHEFDRLLATYVDNL